MRNPIESYRNTSDPRDRRLIQSAAVLQCRPYVSRLVRRTFAPRRQMEAEQVGVIGVLVALENFDPRRGPSFRALVHRHVRQELDRWTGRS